MTRIKKHQKTESHFQKRVDSRIRIEKNATIHSIIKHNQNNGMKNNKNVRYLKAIVSNEKKIFENSEEEDDYSEEYEDREKEKRHRRRQKENERKKKKTRRKKKKPKREK